MVGEEIKYRSIDTIKGEQRFTLPKRAKKSQLISSQDLCGKSDQIKNKTQNLNYQLNKIITMVKHSTSKPSPLAYLSQTI